METIKEQNAQINRLMSQDSDKIKSCRSAHKATLNCLRHLLTNRGFQPGEEFITLIKECSEVTQLTSTFLLEDSEFKDQICGICSEICIECAESCESINPQDSILILCAQSCRECAELCIKFNAHLSHF